MPRQTRRGRHEAARRGLVATAVGWFGELLLTAGAIVLLFVVYLLWGTAIQTAHAQDDLEQELSARWGHTSQDTHAEQPDDVDSGEAYGVLRIPRFGADYEWTIVQGVSNDDLKRGPGHYPHTADPGELGNVGIAAHRAGHGEPFAQFPQLRVGDIVEIQMAEGTYVYRLDDAPNGNSNGNKITIADTWVVDPVPGQPRNTTPTERRITLTTCWPRFGSSHRMYATGILVSGAEGPAQND
jgi:sortase A